nr:hypothetical protein [Mycobacterium lepromatosis]
MPVDQIISVGVFDWIYAHRPAANVRAQGINECLSGWWFDAGRVVGTAGTITTLHVGGMARRPQMVKRR